jgi:DNA polymerase V
MVDAGLLDNDVVVVDRSIPGRVNGIVVAVWQGGLVVKRLRWVDKRLALVAENRLETYPALYLDEDPDHVIWGTAIGAARKL